jgi:hypothetical protein
LTLRGIEENPRGCTSKEFHIQDNGELRLLGTFGQLQEETSYLEEKRLSKQEASEDMDKISRTTRPSFAR